MFKIYDGRDRFYQWDLDRQIIVNDPDINQVHFCNRTDSCSLVSEVKTIDGLRIANVPNILLQEDWKIKVYAYDHNYTKHSATYEVEKRSKPADYIYTETEVFQYEQLVERMDGIDNTIEDRVNDYLTANPPKADLEGYATEDYVNEQIGNIEFPETDLTGYATTEYVDKAVEDVEVDLTGYATEQYVQDEIGKIPKTDLSNYYTKTQTVSAIDASLKYYAKKADIPTIPDHSQYALKSEIPDTTGLATEDYVDTAIENIDIPETDLSNYYNKSEVDELIENIDIPGGGGDVVSVEEVHIGTNEPTDENIKLWVNPDEQESFATLSEVDTKIANAIAAITDGEEVAY